MAAKKLPLGIRNNNPGNLEWGSPWEGLIPREQATLPDGKRFAQFKEDVWGIRALVRTLITYIDKRRADNGSKIDTVREVITRWAPGFENNVEAYAQAVARGMGIDPDMEVDLKDYDLMKAMVIGIIAHENAGYRYPDLVITEGMRRAGIVRREANKAVPLTKEVVAGAAVPGSAGLGLLGQVAPNVAYSIQDQQDNLSSTQWFRIILGVALVVAAGYVAWVQLKKNESGAL